MSDNDKTYPMNKMEPDVGMGAVYAGPEMMDQARARAVMEQAAALRETMDQQRKDDPLRSLKESILEAGRYRSQPFSYDDLDGKTEEELREILKQVDDMPVTMFEDRAYIPNQPPMMMVYAGPQQMSNGGFMNMFQQQMQPQKREPEPGRAVVGYCHDCGTPLYARSKFCPECGTQLKFLK